MIKYSFRLKQKLDTADFVVIIVFVLNSKPKYLYLAFYFHDI